MPRLSVPSANPELSQQVGMGSRIKHSLEVGVVALEVTPANEALRIAAFGAAAAISGDPMVSAGAYGASTLLIEGGAAVATADLLRTKTGEKTLEWVNGKLEHIGISRDAKTNSVSKAGVALIGGSAVLLAIKQREEPDRTFTQNKRYGLASASALSAVCTVQGYLVAEGIANPQPDTIGAAAIAVGGVYGLAKWMRSRTKKAKGENQDVIN